MDNPAWFKPIHGNSNKPHYRRWFDSKRYAERQNIDWELGEYTDYIDRLPDGYKKGYKLVRIDRKQGYIQGNLRWVTMEAKPKPVVKKRKKRRKTAKKLTCYCDTSPNWKGF